VRSIGGRGGWRKGKIEREGGGEKKNGEDVTIQG